MSEPESDLATPVSERLEDRDEQVAAGRRKLEWARAHMPILAADGQELGGDRKSVV